MSSKIPKDVEEKASVRYTEGFSVENKWYRIIKGSDGEMYVRVNGVISVAPSDDSARRRFGTYFSDSNQKRQG